MRYYLKDFMTTVSDAVIVITRHSVEFYRV